ncbi:MAG TPA: cytidine/deoxycytidylate deaminase family protein [Bacilli bacterium]|nr:cytidine/deoxycytidylate deaminase family protein [Bacilli bacterium]
MSTKDITKLKELTNKEKLSLVSTLLDSFKERLDWDHYYMLIAETVAVRSTCRRHVGAIIVKDYVVVSTGYNGAPSGIKHCAERGGCLRQQLNIPSGTKQEICRAIHAEQNAMIRASKRDMEGATLYVNTFPCAICTRMIINARITRIVYKGDYQDELSKEMLAESGIEIIKID